MYNWIESTFNVSGGVTQAIAVVLALAVVLLLFSLFIFILKRLMGARAPQNRNRQPRIAVMDSASVDARRRLILIRRDNIEHLLLVGGPSDVVVEQNIVRNSPLPSGRSAGYPAHGGNGQVKGPSAPGPDIPARPDELMPDTDPVPAAPPQARTPLPTPAVSSQVSKPASVNESKAPAAPLESKPMAASPAPSLSTQRRPSAPRPEPASEKNHAADLLKAATQNGFSRSKPPVDETLAGEPETPAAPTQAPEVKLEVPKQSAPAAEKDPTTFKTLARPFSPKDRPSYGTQSITPPASGPAARAKTALVKPVEPQVRTDVTTEASVMPEIAVKFEEPGSKAPSVTAHTQSSEDTPEVSLAADEGSQVTEAALLADLVENNTEQAAEMSSDAVQNKDQEPAQKTDEPPAVTAEATTAENSTDPTPGETTGEAAQSHDIKLEMDDLIEPVVEAKSDEQPQEQSQGLDTLRAIKEPKEPASGPAVAPVRPAPKPTQGLGDKNPIEDEMAKILDELGGQPN
ncbi:flagellar biosynthetic protein FliO [uncultured Roseibium sp.]|uniref:flagellar biosynthetic protein FliO n=1 Tax=uncultured Roseibium sp. TaxID=1936171 RepID=UPI00262C5576|nr:flagellar biosynthetic protein FliO [uncultured Roseibium sp.]